MSKPTVILLFVGAAITFVAGAALGLGAVVSGIARGAITLGGPQLVTVNGAAIAGTLAWLVVAGLVMGAGTLAALGSWVAALFNTWRLEDRTWFAALLVLGLCSLGWIAMIAYVAAGPDGTKASHNAPDGAPAVA